jgi:two-component system NarL family response regulator
MLQRKTAMKILVADDHSLFRDGLVSLLEAGGHEVVGQAGDGLEAVEQASTLQPELVLLDINMPRMSGLEALREIRDRMPEVKVVMLTVSEEDAHLVEAIRAGAAGYLLKHLNASEFLQMIKGVEHGQAAISQSMTGRLFNQIVHPSRSEEVGLSEREVEVLRLVAAGRSNREIATELSVSENTVKFHLRNILQRLGVSNRTEAVTVALQKRIL